MLFTQFTAVVALAALGNALPAPSTHKVHEKRHEPSSDWVKGARVDGSTYLPMRIALTQKNLEKGQDYILEV